MKRTVSAVLERAVTYESGKTDVAALINVRSAIGTCFGPPACKPTPSAKGWHL